MWRRNVVGKVVRIKREVLDSILTYAITFHPKESILLLRGKTEKEAVVVYDLLIPPGAVHGETLSSFNPWMLPLDSTIVGVAHSHPSGQLRPSRQDLDVFYGRIMVLTGPPYRSEKDVAVFDGEGRPARFEIID
ncbi:MAG: Mov34/MPN/PAD-1 family protein [Candidatus Geothermarchaeales archaeon]